MEPGTVLVNLRSILRQLNRRRNIELAIEEVQVVANRCHGAYRVSPQRLLVRSQQTESPRVQETAIAWNEQRAREEPRGIKCSEGM
jgi:hypothetical protein